MDVTPLIKAGQQIIQSYAGGGFRISGTAYEGPVIVTPEKTVPWAAPAAFDGLEAGHFEAMRDAEVILLGTGKTMRLLPPDFRKALKDKGLSVEAMGTDAACRTYNVLMAEGRRVAAALLPSV